jgi:hypothetical protein
MIRFVVSKVVRKLTGRNVGVYLKFSNFHIAEPKIPCVTKPRILGGPVFHCPMPRNQRSPQNVGDPLALKIWDPVAWYPMMIDLTQWLLVALMHNRINVRL